MIAREIALLMMAAAFIAGYALSNHDHSGKEAAMMVNTTTGSITSNVAISAYLALPRDDKRDTLLYLSTNNEIPNEAAKAIAEDWCAINKQTRRVCWNAKLNHPIRGVK